MVSLLNGLRKVRIIARKQNVEPREVVLAKENIICVDTEDLYSESELETMKKHQHLVGVKSKSSNSYVGANPKQSRQQKMIDRMNARRDSL